MITPISEVVKRTKWIRNFFRFFGNTVNFDQNHHGDWTIMTTSMWPLVPNALIAIIWIVWQSSLFYAYSENGKHNSIIKVEYTPF